MSRNPYDCGDPQRIKDLRSGASRLPSIGANPYTGESATARYMRIWRERAERTLRQRRRAR